MIAAIVLAIGSAAGWFVYRSNRAQRLRAEVLPRIAALQRDEEFAAAYRLLRSVEKDLAGDPELEKIRNITLFDSTVRTSPPGAELYIKGYGETKEDWLYLGRSPLENVRAPFGYYRWRIQKEGYSTFEGAGTLGMSEVSFTLQPTGTLPPGMVLVPGGTVHDAGCEDARAAAVLYRRLRGDQSRLQAVRRRRRLSEPRVPGPSPL